jgi:hypothetical protein
MGGDKMVKMARILISLLAPMILMEAFWPAMPMAAAQESKTYVSRTHSFSFQYPAAYEVQGARDYLDFKKGGKTIFSLWVDDRFIEMLYQKLHPGIVTYRAGEDPYRELAAETGRNQELFRGYARAEAKNWCAADGPDGSVYCQDFKSEKPFTSRSGLDCLELYPVSTREDFASKTITKGMVGPVLAAYLPQKNLPVLLMMSPVQGQLAPPALVREMRAIVDSLKAVP